MRLHLSLCTAAVAALTLSSCSSGPPPLEKNTPPFWWQAANENWNSSNYIKAVDQLDQIIKTENEFTARARPWRMVMLSGLVRGYSDLAEQYEFGGRANKTNPAPFRKQLTDYRSWGSRYSLRFAEAFEDFEKNFKEAEIPLAFPAPTGTLNPIPQLQQVAMGRMLTPAEAESTQKTAMDKSMLFITCRAAGNTDNSAKTRDMLKPLTAKIDKNTFIFAMATSLYEQSQMYTPMKLDQPDRLNFYITHATEAVNALPESKDTKALKEKLAAAKKAASKRS